MLFISCPIKVTLRSNLCVHDSKVGKFKNGKDGNKYQSAQNLQKEQGGSRLQLSGGKWKIFMQFNSMENTHKKCLDNNRAFKYQKIHAIVGNGESIKAWPDRRR